MKKINPFCESCGTTYNLANPCIHHLPDGYINEQKRKDHNKKRRESKSNDANAKQGVLQQSQSSARYAYIEVRLQYTMYKTIRIKLEDLGLNPNEKIYIEPLSDGGYGGKIDRDQAEQLSIWIKLHKNLVGKGIMYDKRWNNNV